MNILVHLNIWKKELTQKKEEEKDRVKVAQRQVWLTVVFHPYKRFLSDDFDKRWEEEMHLVHKCDQLIAAMELKAFKKQFSMWKTFCYWTHSVWKSQKKSHSTIASEASYVYILSGHKFIKNGTNGSFWRVFENLKLAVKQYYQTGQF